MTVEPTIVLGDPTLNIPPDTLRVSYTKYNNHYHNEVYPSSFRYTPINVGDIVDIFYNGVLVSADDSQVLSITDEELELSKITTNTASLYNCQIRINSKDLTISNVEVGQTTNRLILRKENGFITSTDYRQFKLFKQSYILSNYSLGNSIMLVPPSLFDMFRISRVFVYSSTDTILSVVLEVINSLNNITNEIQLNLTNKQSILTVDSYTLADNKTYSDSGIRIKPIGSQSDILSVTLELITL